MIWVSFVHVTTDRCIKMSVHASDPSCETINTTWNISGIVIYYALRTFGWIYFVLSTNSNTDVLYYKSNGSQQVMLNPVGSVQLNWGLSSNFSSALWYLISWRTPRRFSSCFMGTDGCIERFYMRCAGLWTNLKECRKGQCRQGQGILLGRWLENTKFCLPSRNICNATEHLCFYMFLKKVRKVEVTA
jgi:hypothetical protein